MHVTEIYYRLEAVTSRDNFLKVSMSKLRNSRWTHSLHLTWSGLAGAVRVPGYECLVLGLIVGGGVVVGVAGGGGGGVQVGGAVVGPDRAETMFMMLNISKAYRQTFPRDELISNTFKYIFIFFLTPYCTAAIKVSRRLLTIIYNDSSHIQTHESSLLMQQKF